jgi:protein-S-isoprenylcysteine O-methyltransferase Ste14
VLPEDSRNETTRVGRRRTLAVSCMNHRASALALKVPPPVVLIIAGTLMWLTAKVSPSLIVFFSGRVAGAIAFASFGIASALAGILQFRDARTTVNPHLPANTTTIVTRGIYRFTRNPMYLGLLLVLIAWAVYLANVAAALFLPLFVLYITRYQIQPEERCLIEKFGAPYEDYLRSVRRWL